MKLVIIEDEILLVWAMTLLLEEWDHQVVGSCGTEAEAVALVARLRPDAVLMDIKLAEGGSGLGAARTIRLTSHVPIIFCSAYAHKADIQKETAKLGNTVLLGKPIEEKELALHLARVSADRSGTDDCHARTRPPLEGATPQLAA